jgi:hypothetical protein
MGYSFTWKDIQKICTGLGMERQGKTNIWKGVGGDGIKRAATIHPDHKGTLGPGLACRIAKEQLKFQSIEDMYRYLQNL